MQLWKAATPAQFPVPEDVAVAVAPPVVGVDVRVAVAAEVAVAVGVAWPRIETCTQSASRVVGKTVVPSGLPGQLPPTASFMMTKNGFPAPNSSVPLIAPAMFASPT